MEKSKSLSQKKESNERKREKKKKKKRMSSEQYNALKHQRDAVKARLDAQNQKDDKTAEQNCEDCMRIPRTPEVILAVFSRVGMEDEEEELSGKRIPPC